VEAPDTLVVGTVTLIYDHHSRLLPEKLTDLQHESHELIISTTHVQLDHHTCLEVVVVKANSAWVRKLADLLIGTKGVQHGRLMMTAPGADASSGANAALPKTA
jgi:CopG family nickel-responsive transcriptional regulator